MKKLSYRILLAVVAIFVIPSWVVVYIMDEWPEIWGDVKNSYRVGWLAFKKGSQLTDPDEWGA